MTPPPELVPRYDPGEDVRPLVRSLAGGVVGGLAALGIDRLVGLVTGRPLVLPGLVAGGATGDAAATALGTGIVIGLCCLAALVYTYGQCRRFAPGPPCFKGAAWATLAWSVAAPALLPAAAGLPGAPTGASVTAAIVWAFLAAWETLVVALVIGAVIGALNPPRGD